MVIDAGRRLCLGKTFYTDVVIFRTLDSEGYGWLETKAEYDLTCIHVESGLEEWSHLS
jgi:hypothetical protein